MGHNGLDITSPSGTEILYPHDGKITELTFDASGYGNYVKIENDFEASILAHMKTKPNGKVGDTVKEGQVAGIVGSTGNSSGPHLHWGYIRNPRNRDNGFNGYVDQTHWLELKETSCEKVEALLKEALTEKDKYKKEARDLRLTIEELTKQAKNAKDLCQQFEVQLNNVKEYLVETQKNLTAYKDLHEKALADQGKLTAKIEEYKMEMNRLKAQEFTLTEILKLLANLAKRKVVVTRNG